MSSAAHRTRQEIEQLKLDWAGDPTRDIEDTAGFEAHYSELLAYREAYKDAIDRAKQADWRAFLEKVGCTDNPALGREIKQLRDTLCQVVQQLAAREGT